MKKHSKHCLPQLKRLVVMVALASGTGQVLADPGQICVGDAILGIVPDCDTAPNTTMNTGGANILVTGGAIEPDGTVTGSYAGDEVEIGSWWINVNDGFADDSTTIVGGDITIQDGGTTTATITADGAITGTSLSAGSGAITGGSLNVGTGSITGGATSVSSLNVNNGGITNAGAISGATSITASGAITSDSLRTNTISNANDLVINVNDDGGVVGDVIMQEDGTTFFQADATTTTISSTNTNITGVLTVGSGTITIDGDAETITGGSGGDMLTISDPDGVAIDSPLSMNGNVISNLADGVAPSDAVTVGQLDSAVGSLSGAIEDTRTDAFRGIAISNAMEVVHLDPDKNFGVNVGFGYYKNETALGITGTGRMTDNAQVYFGLGSDTSFQETGAKAGVSLQW